MQCIKYFFIILVRYKMPLPLGVTFQLLSIIAPNSYKKLPSLN